MCLIPLILKWKQFNVENVHKKINVLIKKMENVIHNVQ